MLPSFFLSLLALPLSHCCSLVVVVLRSSIRNAAAVFTVCCHDAAGIAQPVASCAALLYQRWLIVACCLLCHLLLVSCCLSFYFLFLVDCHLLFIVCHCHCSFVFETTLVPVPGTRYQVPCRPYLVPYKRSQKPYILGGIVERGTRPFR